MTILPPAFFAKLDDLNQTMREDLADMDARRAAEQPAEEFATCVPQEPEPHGWRAVISHLRNNWRLYRWPLTLVGAVAIYGVGILSTRCGG